jgi:CRP-like cAMP-binding protein
MLIIFHVGEVAIIFEQKRMASVRAVTFCDIMVLSKEDFDGVVCQYPEVMQMLLMLHSC